MLSYGFRVVWFALSLSGLLSSWVSLPAFPRLITQEVWAPATYGVVDTALQAVFCLGLIWRMDSSHMPKGFCVAQTVLTHVSWSFMTALCAALTLKTSADVFHDTRLGTPLRKASGRLSRIALIFLFPTVILILQLIFLLKLDAAAQPNDSLSCDASHPAWIRLLGYAGTNLLLAVPALVLSIISALRLLCPRPHQPSMLTATTRTAYSTSALTSLPSRRSRASRSRANPALKDLFPPDEPPLPPTAPLRLPKMLLDPRPPAHGVAGRAPAQAKHSKFHLPFTPAGSVRHAPSPQPSVGSAQGSQRTAPSPIVFSSPAARAEPTVVPLAPSPAPPDAFYAHDYHDFGRGAFDDESGESGEGAHGDEKGGDDGSDGSITEVHHAHGHVLEVSDDGGVVGSFRWVRDPERESFSKDKDAFYAVGYGEADEDRLDAPSPSPYAFPPYPRIRRSPSGQPPWLAEDPPPAPPPPLRVIAFQAFLACTLVVASLSALVDILGRRAPAPFGTQHVALVLAAWGPALAAGGALLANRRRRI